MILLVESYFPYFASNVRCSRGPIGPATARGVARYGNPSKKKDARISNLPLIHSGATSFLKLNDIYKRFVVNDFLITGRPLKVKSF